MDNFHRRSKQLYPTEYQSNDTIPIEKKLVMNLIMS